MVKGWIVVAKATHLPFTTYLKGERTGQPVIFESKEKAMENCARVADLGFAKPGSLTVAYYEEIEDDCSESAT